jgi:serine/threonine protein kinase
LFSRASLTKLNAHFGIVFSLRTPAYQSPEQARGLTDHRSDLYSLGVLLFQLYTEHLPIKGSSFHSFRLGHMLDPPLIVSALRECHPMFEKLIARLLVKEPQKRYATASGLKYDLELLVALLKTDTLGVETFELGTREEPFILMLPNQLIGRSEELSALIQLYDKCLDPEHGGFCFLEGKPGVGKTALIRAFASQQRNPFFFLYKFNQFGDTPMEAIIRVSRSTRCA